MNFLVLSSDMRLSLLSFVVAALSVQLAVSHPFDKPAFDSMYKHIISILPFVSLSFILDTAVLNYALTLEHLENAFYAGALAQFDDKDFRDAGLPSWAHTRFVEIAAHEARHVAVLNAALGDQATQPCTYSLCVFSSGIKVLEEG